MSFFISYITFIRSFFLPPILILTVFYSSDSFLLISVILFSYLLLPSSRFLFLLTPYFTLFSTILSPLIPFLLTSQVPSLLPQPLSIRHKRGEETTLLSLCYLGHITRLIYSLCRTSALCPSLRLTCSRTILWTQFAYGNCINADGYFLVEDKICHSFYLYIFFQHFLISLCTS